jgi:ribonuclease Z
MRKLVNLGYFAPAYEIISHELQGEDKILFDGYSIKCMFVNHNVPTLSYSLEEDMRPGRFNKKRALKLGVPEGPLFRKLQRGEKIEVNGRVISPSMVLSEPRLGRKITISGDTAPCNALISFAAKSDVLIHDATFDSSFEKKANEYGHSTAYQAGEIGKKAGVEKLCLTHISPRYKNADVLEKEAQEVFQNAVIAHDFMEVEVKLKK